MWLVFTCFLCGYIRKLSHVHGCTGDETSESTMVFSMKRIKCRQMILHSADELTES